MAQIKSYADISQSKKLTEILPIESADMYYMEASYNNYTIGVLQRMERDMLLKQAEYYKMLPCWSLSALLGVLPKTINHETLFIETSPALWHIGYRNVYTARTDNPVDACYELVLKLNELNLL